MKSLPEPSATALEVSRRLVQYLHKDIAAHGGWISFARYLELAMYSPGLGYYSGGSTKLGSDGDFTTAPEISPLYGASLARVAQTVFEQTAPVVLEFGAGTGSLAESFLNECKRGGYLPQAYYILDLSGELRERQQKRLQDFDCVQWLDRMPAQFSGLVLANEVLDAMPFHVVQKLEQGWQELGVVVADNGFAWAARPSAEADQWCARQILEQSDLMPGYQTEVHPGALAFTHTLADMMRAGYQATGKGAAAILVDYGFPWHEYYLPQRNQGTLMCHYRHHAHTDPFYLPGLQDVTTHIDFTAVARTAHEAGLDLLTYTSQAAFLLTAGIGDILARTSPDAAAHYLRQSNAIHQLTSPAEMGELFKVLMLGVGVELPDAFLAHDRCHRL